jgi:predicted methyltransferase
MRIHKLLLALIVTTGTSSVMADHHEADAMRTALTNSSRAEADKARDAGRKPADVLMILGIGSGMTVMDLIAAGGYYTEVLSIAVGADGTVYAQNPAAVLKFRDGANDKAMTARLAGDRLANVVRLDREIRDLGLEPESLDAVITALNFHDVYNNDPEVAAGMLQVIRGLLKPGGVLGIIDHVGIAGASNAELHRIEKDKVVEAAIAAGFAVSADSTVLANPDDDHSQMVFAADIRGKTDRFLLRFINPD